jgi:hypothetical protein
MNGSELNNAHIVGLIDEEKKNACNGCEELARM